MRIHPDDGHLAVQPFPDGFRGAGDGPYGDGVVAPERQDAAALLRVLVDLLAEPLRDGADGEWVFHVAVIGVRGRHDGGVGVDGVVVEEVIAEVFFELGQETGGDEGCGCGIDAGFALFCFWGLLRSPTGKENWGWGCLFFTWPPEKPTAMTPSSLLLDRNLGLMVEGEVMIPAVFGMIKVGPGRSDDGITGCLCRGWRE